MSNSYGSANLSMDHDEQTEPFRAGEPGQVKDIVHDLIEISPRLREFIDTPQFQRLRYIKQLGLSYLVWPCASHSRYEHSIGVAHLARTLVENIRHAQPELGITDRDVECVEVAGLCHDLGHGPWSHTWDGSFIPDVLPDEDWTHEKGSEMMLDYLVKDNNVVIEDKDLNFIKALILGDPTRCSRDEKPFLFEIVANKRNGLDVDKYDYIQRDSLMLGDPIKINVNRMLMSARVIDNEITYNIKDLSNIMEVFRTRFKLHEKYYNHKTVKIAEYMVLEALKIANPVLNIAERIRDPEEFVMLSDFVMHEIKFSRDPRLAEARKIFARIEKRDFFKRADWKLIPYEKSRTFKQHITSQGIFEELRAKFAGAALTIDGGTLSAEDIIMEFSTLHHGMMEKNPLDSVKFYSKYHPKKSQYAKPGDYSTLMPHSFAEVMMRVYTKKPQFFGLVQTGYRAVLRKVADGQDVDQGSSSISFSAIASPPATEAPTSPRLDAAEEWVQPHSSIRSVKPISKTESGDNPFMTVNRNYVALSPYNSTPNKKRKLSDLETLEPGEMSPTLQGMRRRLGKELEDVKPLEFEDTRRNLAGGGDTDAGTSSLMSVDGVGSGSGGGAMDT